MKLGVREVATHMSVSENAVFRWVERDGLPATQVDGQFRFHPEAVYEWATELGLPIAGNPGNYLKTTMKPSKLAFLVTSIVCILLASLTAGAQQPQQPSRPARVGWMSL